MPEIPLTQGKVALVDEQDYERVAVLKWHARRTKRNYWYAVASPAQNIHVYMHRVILGCQPGQQVDHINHDGLDNRRRNLRLCSHSQNLANSRPRRNTSSRFKGVSWDTYYKCWRARICHNERKHHLGRFDSEEEAARAYNVKAQELFGEFALINNI